MFLEIASESTSLATTNFQTTKKQSNLIIKIPVFTFDTLLFRESQRGDDPWILPLQPGAAGHQPEAEEGRAREEQGEGGAGRAHRVTGEVELGLKWWLVSTFENTVLTFFFTGRKPFPFNGIITVMFFLFCLTPWTGLASKGKNGYSNSWSLRILKL